MKSRTVQPIRSGKRSGDHFITSFLRWYQKKKAKEQYFDYNLLMIVIFLTCFGLVMLYSTSSYTAQDKFGSSTYYFSRQAIISVVCFAAMMIVSEIDYHLYAPFVWHIYGLAMFMMALVRWSPLGVESYGSRRWLQLPAGLTMQPSELAKVAIILLMPYLLCKAGKYAYSLEGMIRTMIPGLVAAGAVYYLTDNLSTAIIVAGITAGLIFVVHPKKKPFLIAVCIAALLMFLGVQFILANADSLAESGFRMQRVLSWLKPEEYAADGSYQVTQALYAIGSGGVFGKGLGNSTQKMVIPEVQNDMILSIVCEELGIFGALVVLFLFAFLLYRLLFIAQNAPDMYGSLVASGIFMHIALQVIFNVMVVTKVMPTTGITLPFVSYGGTSILFLMAEMGIVLNISRSIPLSGE